MTFSPLKAALAAMLLTPTALGQDDMRLVFHEAFDGEKLNTGKWHIVTGDGCPKNCGFGNNELQSYSKSSSNLRLEDGKLIIEAHKGRKITSAKVTTEAVEGWKYGRIEVRAKLPSGTGTWPAIWMLPDDWAYGAWPKSGEIDIMEHVGYDESKVHGTVHTEAYNHSVGTQRGGQSSLKSATSTFHIYAIDWSGTNISWYIDGEKYYSFDRERDATPAEWPFDHPFHIILNLAIGGDWGGAKGMDARAFPARFEIDWVKVWQRAEDEIANPK